MSKPYLRCQRPHVVIYDEPVVIDPLGAPTPEQVTEVKDSRARRAFNAVLVTIVLAVAAVVLMGAGVYIGATKPDTWNYVPFTPEPSGERAEPEEGAK